MATHFCHLPKSKCEFLPPLRISLNHKFDGTALQISQGGRILCLEKGFEDKFMKMFHISHYGDDYDDSWMEEKSKKLA
jgi:hypothetical protein